VNDHVSNGTPDAPVFCVRSHMWQKRRAAG
jgi:hypothetical protein